MIISHLDGAPASSARVHDHRLEFGSRAEGWLSAFMLKEIHEQTSRGGQTRSRDG
jgi:hypothetical protein